MLLLVLWHGLRSGWWPLPDGLPLPMGWEQAGALDNVRLRIYGEWQRLFTALTLHADAVELSERCQIERLCNASHVAGDGTADVSLFRPTCSQTHLKRRKA